MRDTTIVDDLRKFADYLEERPGLADKVTRPTFYIFTRNTDNWHDCLREMGTFEKSADDLDLEAVVKFGGLKLKACISKEETCERVQTSTRIVERPVYPDTPIRVETVEEPIYEWVCPDSWLTNNERTP